jgi:hypothetical protein
MPLLFPLECMLVQSSRSSLRADRRLLLSQLPRPQLRQQRMEPTDLRLAIIIHSQLRTSQPLHLRQRLLLKGTTDSRRVSIILTLSRLYPQNLTLILDRRIPQQRPTPHHHRILRQVPSTVPRSVWRDTWRIFILLSWHLFHRKSLFKSS